MSQGWPSIAGADKIRLSRADIVERTESVRTLFSGETPPDNPAPSQPWYKPSAKELFIYDADAEEWELLVKPSVGGAPGYVTPESYGAVGVLPGMPVNDCKAAFLAALATGLRVQGNPSLVYGIDGTMTICTSGNSAWIARCRFRQMNPADAARRTLYASGGDQVVLEDVKVDRAGDGAGGSISDAAGVWIANVTRVFAADLEVYGNDKGTGVLFANCDNVVARGLYVHDIRGGNASHATITDDIVCGISVLGCDRVYLENPRVDNLTTQWSGQAKWRRWTRGIAFGQGADGSRRVTIVAPMVDGTDQAVDITGGGNVRHGCIVGGYLKDPMTYGIKFANNPQFWTVVGIVSEGAGRCCAVVSGNAALSPQTSKIMFIGCHFLAPGRSTDYWRVTQGEDLSAARILNTATTDWPREILFRDCIFDGAGGYMKYAIHNQAVLGGSGDQWVEQEGCHVANRLSGGRDYFGLHQGYAERVRNAAQSAANATWTDVSFDVVPFDRMATTSLGATIVRLLRGGVYVMTGSVYCDYAAGGSREVRLVRQRNGETSFTEVPGSYQRLPPLGAGQMAFPVTAIVEGNAQTQVKLQVRQDSGSSVNFYAKLTIAMIQKGTTIS